VPRSSKHCVHRKATIRPLFVVVVVVVVVVGVDVAVNNIKVPLLLWNCQNVCLLRFCWAENHFVILPTKLSIKCSECVFVFLSYYLIYQAWRSHLSCAVFVIDGPVRLCRISPHYLIKRQDCRKHFFEHKMCFYFLYTFRLKHLSF